MRYVADGWRLWRHRPYDSYERSEKHEWKALARVVSVYDGDTVTLLIRFNGRLVRWRARMMGYDAPELRVGDEVEKARAVMAKEFLETLMPSGIFTVRVKGLDKYGRLLIDPTCKGVKISTIMIANKHGYEYDGGRKRRA